MARSMAKLSGRRKTWRGHSNPKLNERDLPGTADERVRAEKCRHQKQVGSMPAVAKNKTEDLTKGVGIMPFGYVVCSLVGMLYGIFLLSRISL
jgi:hypothetical protein